MSKWIKGLAVACALGSVTVSSVSDASEVAPVKFVNQTQAGMQFYIDGQGSCWAAAGDYCTDSTSEGTHTFYSTWADPNYQPGTACSATQVYVPAAGYTWTCY